MKTLIIDNYDSFTYNLFQYVAKLGGKPIVHTNDKLNLSEINRLDPSHIIISPGPGTVTNKNDFGICEEVILKMGPNIPLLGVCLGHQGIAHAFGAEIEHAPKIFHGKQSLIEYQNTNLNECSYPDIFNKILNPFWAMRYHSLIVSKENFPEELKITAWIKDNPQLVMAIQHRKFPIYGIQFHPESFGTDVGLDLLNNFLKIAK